MGKLDGKVAMITGAGRGHAEAVARLFAKEGAAVSICDILPVNELEEQVGAKIKAEGGKGALLPDRCFQRGAGAKDGRGNPATFWNHRYSGQCGWYCWTDQRCLGDDLGRVETNPRYQSRFALSLLQGSPS